MYNNKYNSLLFYEIYHFLLIFYILKNNKLLKLLQVLD